MERCVADAGIVRHRGKIESTINNAKRAQEMQADFGSLAAYFWAHEPGPDERPDRVTYDVMIKITKTETSTRISKGSEETRLVLRWPHHHLCLYAGHGSGQ